MSYVYEEEKSQLFTDEGQRKFLKVRDAARDLLKEAGAFRMQELIDKSRICGDSFFQIACVDRLVELREIIEVRSNCATQHKIYTSRWA